MNKENNAKVLAALEESLGLVEHDYETNWRHGLPTRKAQLDGMREGVELHKEAIAIMRKEPQGWMPIEEEPPHTQDILVYCDDTKEQFVAFRLPSGRYQFANAGNGLIVCCEPTHWMPLPAPPALLEKAR